MSRVRKPTAKSRRVETKSEAKSKKTETRTPVEEKAKSVAKPIALTGVGKSGTKISKLPEGAAAAPKPQEMSQSISQSLKSICDASTGLRNSLLTRSGIASLLLVATALLAGGGLLFQNQSEQASAVVAPVSAPAPMAQAPAASVAKKPVVAVKKAHKKVAAKKPAAKAVAKSQVKSHGKKQTSAKESRHANRRLVATTQY